jgi:hypothetical protein
MRKLIIELKQVILSVINANMNLQHYWFIAKPQTVKVKAVRFEDQLSSRRRKM